VSADRRFKFAFVAVFLLVLLGFGTWYGFQTDDDGAREVAQDAIVQDQRARDSLTRDILSPTQEAAVPDTAPPDRAMQEASVGDAASLDAVAPSPEDVGQGEVEIAAVDPSGDVGPGSEIAAAPSAPVFDIVRVEPSGDAVIAGRGNPGAVVELLRNGVVHDRLVADASGAFAFVPPPFPAGTSEIVLRIIDQDGAARRSEQSVTVVVADDLLTTPMVALAAPNQPTIVLSRPEEDTVEVAAAQALSEELSGEGLVAGIADAQTPEDDTAPVDRQQLAAADAGAYVDGDGTIRIASVEAETGGGLYVTGEVAPNGIVRLYLNDTFVAPAEADSDGTVSFSIERGVRPGSYRVRLDHVAGETGSVLSRAEIVFVVPELPARVAETPVIVPDATASPEPAEQVETEERLVAEVAPERAATAIIPEISTAVVERGDSLWRISRQVYGSGFRYTEIFEANQNQIRNPDLIYPGQLFVLPADPRRAGADEAEQSLN